MSYAVHYTPRAEKELASLADWVQKKVATRVKTLADAPRGRGVRKLREGVEPPTYRVRVAGDYRVLFTIDDARQQIRIVGVRPRKDAYRQR